VSSTQQGSGERTVLHPVRDYAAGRYHEPRRVHAWSSEEAPGWPDSFRTLRPACGKVVQYTRHKSYGLAPDTPVTCPGCRAALSLTGAER
jgi:hypothetical protein